MLWATSAICWKASGIWIRCGPISVRITADGETLDGEYLFGAVANSTSIAGMMKLERRGGRSGRRPL